MNLLKEAGVTRWKDLRPLRGDLIYHKVIWEKYHPIMLAENLLLDYLEFLTQLLKDQNSDLNTSMLLL